MLVSTNRPIDGYTGNIYSLYRCIVTSEITETVDIDTKIGLLISTEIKRGEITTQIAVTVTSTETLQTCKHCTNDL